MGASPSVIQTSLFLTKLLRDLTTLSSQQLLLNSPVSSKKDKLTVQDEARVFKSKLGAVRLILRNETSRVMFLKLLEVNSKQDYALKFSLLDVMRKEILDTAKSRSLDDVNNDYEVPVHLYSISSPNVNVKTMIQKLLHPIHQLSQNQHTTNRMWLKQISKVQDELLSQLFGEFEQLMVSESFQSARTIDNISRSYSCSMSSFAENEPRTTVHGGISTRFAV